MADLSHMHLPSLPFPTRLMDVSVAPRDSLLPLDASLLVKELERAQTPSFGLHDTAGPT